jgi:hypothetical protein
MMMWNKTVIQSTYKKLDQLLHYIACIIYKNVQLFFKEIFLGKENEISFRMFRIILVFDMKISKIN